MRGQAACAEGWRRYPSPGTRETARVGSVEDWWAEHPRRAPAAYAVELADDPFWGDPDVRLIASHPELEEAAPLLDAPVEVAHALALVVARLPVASRRPFADRFYAAPRGGFREAPADERGRLALAAAVALRALPLAGRGDLASERIRDLLEGARQGDDLALTPDTALAEVRKAVARVRLDLELEDPEDPRAAAAIAVVEVLDPSSGAVALQEIVARTAWAAVATWEPGRVLELLLALDGLF